MIFTWSFENRPRLSLTERLDLVNGIIAYFRVFSTSRRAIVLSFSNFAYELNERSFNSLIWTSFPANFFWSCSTSARLVNLTILRSFSRCRGWLLNRLVWIWFVLGAQKSEQERSVAQCWWYGLSCKRWEWASDNRLHPLRKKRIRRRYRERCSNGGVFWWTMIVCGRVNDIGNQGRKNPGNVPQDFEIFCSPSAPSLWPKIVRRWSIISNETLASLF